MFSKDAQLTSLDLTSFDTSNVTYMNGIFSKCKKIKDINLSSFNTYNVVDMQSMFLECDNLISLDLTSFDTQNVCVMYRMFAECMNLTKIYVSDKWSTINVTGESSSTHMFNACRNLIGGKGTIYDPRYTNKTYACIDGGTSNPGYLTEKK